MADGDGKTAKTLLSGDAIGFPHRPAAALLAPWASAMAGDVEGSLVRPEVRGDKLVDYFGQVGQAYLFERAKRYDEAETAYKAVTAGDSPGITHPSLTRRSSRPRLAAVVVGAEPR